MNTDTRSTPTTAILRLLQLLLLLQLLPLLQLLHLPHVDKEYCVMFHGAWGRRHSGHFMGSNMNFNLDVQKSAAAPRNIDKDGRLFCGEF